MGRGKPSKQIKGSPRFLLLQSKNGVQKPFLKTGQDLQSHKSRKKTNLKYLKMKKLIFTTIIAIFLTSCQPAIYYQMYKVNAIDELSKTNNSLIYEDDNCKVLYDFWSQGGSVDFLFYNKTSENIYINKEESFFVLNSIAYDYYNNRTITNSNSTIKTSSNSETEAISILNGIGAAFSMSETGYNYKGFKQTNSIAAEVIAAKEASRSTTHTKGTITSSEYSEAIKEKKIVCIPSKTAKIIGGHKIINSLYRDCDLIRYPSVKEIKKIQFTTENVSPFVFSNKISYTVGDSKNLVKIENKFYVSEISNYPEKKITVEKADEFCNQKSGFYTTKYLKNVSPDKFYFQYKHVYYTDLKH
jgi:hypothetical protein